MRSLGDPVELEEERRLCYVGITRAERHLYLSHAWSRMIYGHGGPSELPSRFLNEIPAELVARHRRRTELGFVPRHLGVRIGIRRDEWVRVPEDGARREPGTPGRSAFGTGVSPGEGAFYPDGRRRRAPATTGAELLGLEVGDVVVHGSWGEGRVVSTAGTGDDAEAEVIFTSVGRKRLLLRMAPIKRA